MHERLCKPVADPQEAGIEVHLCPPRSPNTKGKIEAGVKYVKSNALKGRSFTSLEQSGIDQ